MLRSWDVETGMPIGVVELAHTPTGVRFTPNGAQLAVSLGTTRIRLLDPVTLRPLSNVEQNSEGEFAVSEDGRYVASLTSNSVVTVTEVRSGLPRLEIDIDSSPGVRFAFHPDSKSIAVADRKGKVSLYKLAGGKPLLTVDHGSAITGLAFSPDGKRLATSSDAPAEVVKVWVINAGQGAKTDGPIAEIKGASRPHAWFGSERVAVASREGAGIYNLAKKEWTGFVKGVSGIWAVSPDEKRIASAATSSVRVRVWNLVSGQQLHAENGSFADAALLMPTPDGRSIFIIAGEAGYLWPMGKPEPKPLGRLPARAVTAAAGGGQLAVAMHHGVLVYDRFDPTKGLTEKAWLTAKDLPAELRAIAVSPDGKTMVYCGEGARLVVADATTGKKSRLLPMKSLALALAFSPDSRKLAAIGNDGFLHLWPLDSPNTREAENTDLWRGRLQRAKRAGVAFSPDGKLVAATSATLLNVYDTTTGEQHFSIDRHDLDDGNFQQVLFSPDSRLLIAGSGGLTGAIQVFEVATRSLVRRFTTGYGAITRLSIFPDGTRLVSAGMDEVLTVWEITSHAGRGTPTIEELATAWTDLASLDAGKGYPAVQTLIAGGSAGVEVIAGKVGGIIEGQQTLERWVKELASNDAAERKSATEALIGMGIAALPALQIAATQASSAEARTRAGNLISQLNGKGVRLPVHGLDEETLRLLRIVQVLEHLGNTDAKAILIPISTLSGRAGAEATAALKRLKK